MLKKIFNRIRNITLNNVVTNHVLILVKKDYLIKKWRNNWADMEYNTEMSPQENVGCSHSPLVQGFADKTHAVLKQKIKENFSDKKTVMDMGCGTGLYLKDFPEEFSLTGIDLNAEFLKVAEEIVPRIKTIHGNYLHIDINEKYDVIISIGVLMYIEPSSLKKMIKKLFDNLNVGGKIFFQYSHALLYKDLVFSDLSYVRYSPTYFEKALAPYFTIIEHKHFFDDRTVEKYDKDRYYYPNGKEDRVDTVQNSYLLIAEKKNL
jgi:2-polyprenyl-3-methyl-5-hydroxy-6-metoxy-1,4-benzoquinol methylase